MDTAVATLATERFRTLNDHGIYWDTNRQYVLQYDIRVQYTAVRTETEGKTDSTYVLARQHRLTLPQELRKSSFNSVVDHVTIYYVLSI